MKTHTHNILYMCNELGSGGSKGGGGQGGQDPPWDSREKVPAHGKIAFICWRIVSKFVWLDLSPKDDQNRGEDTKISKKFLGENPPKQYV